MTAFLKRVVWEHNPGKPGPCFYIGQPLPLAETFPIPSLHAQLSLLNALHFTSDIAKTPHTGIYLSLRMYTDVMLALGALPAWHGYLDFKSCTWQMSEEECERWLHALRQWADSQT